MNDTGFWLGNERNLDPEHIGRVVVVDWYSRKLFQSTGVDTEFTLKTYVGTLAGYSENRGKGAYGPSELGYQADGKTLYPDMSAHPDFAYLILFEDGRAFTVEETDYAHIYLPTIKKGAHA